MTLEEIEILLSTPEVKGNVLAVDNNKALREAAKRGAAVLVEQLLRFHEVKELAAARNNEALRFSISGKHISVANLLLDEPTVRYKAACLGNLSLYKAVEFDLPELVYRLLSIQVVREKIMQSPLLPGNNAFSLALSRGKLEQIELFFSYQDIVIGLAKECSEYLKYAAENSQDEIAYIIAKAQWPEGLKYAPKEIRDDANIISSIKRGAAEVSERRARILRITSAYNPRCSSNSSLPQEVVFNVLSFMYGHQSAQRIIRDVDESMQRQCISSIDMDVEISEVVSKKRTLEPEDMLAETGGSSSCSSPRMRQKF